jgi:hypothetical protein
VTPVLYKIRKTPRSPARIEYVDKFKPYFGPEVENRNVTKPKSGIKSSVNVEDLSVIESDVRPKRDIKLPQRYR